MSEQAKQAIKAVDLYHSCGRYAAMQYAKKNGVVSLYRLARQLNAAQ